MPRGSKLGAKRGPYRPHTRRGLVSDAQVRAIRQAVSVDAALAELARAGVSVSPATISAIRRRTRKALVPDLPIQTEELTTMTTQWFPADQYKQAITHAIMTARDVGGRCQIGIEKITEYGKPGYRSGFHLPKPDNRCGFELRCEAINASDPLPRLD